MDSEIHSLVLALDKSWVVCFAGCKLYFKQEKESLIL